MGVITMLLYGVIAVQGFRIFVEQNVLKGMIFAAIIGVVLSLIFWLFNKLGLMNKEG